MKVCQADQPTLALMKEDGVEIFAGVVEHGQALYLPWGHCIVEEVINGADVTGIRWMAIQDERSPAFEALLSKISPSDVVKVKPNTSLGFLLKVVDAQNHLAKQKEVPVAHVVQKIKVERGEATSSCCSQAGVASQKAQSLAARICFASM